MLYLSLGILKCLCVLLREVSVFVFFNFVMSSPSLGVMDVCVCVTLNINCVYVLFHIFYFVKNLRKFAW
jgi:hypothetical protein